jgi:WD40 repeat protein
LPEFARGRLGTIRFRHARKVIVSVRFAPSGKELLSVGTDRIARVWETDTGKERYHFTLPNNHLSEDKWVLTPDFRTMITWIHGPSIRVWQTSTGKMVREWSIANHNVEELALAPDGKTVAALAVDGKEKSMIRLWDFKTGKEIRDICPGSAKGEEKGITFRRLFFPAAGKILALIGTSGEDGVLRLWDLATGEELPAVARIPAWENDSSLSRDAKFLALAAKVGDKAVQIRLVDVPTGKKLHDLGKALVGKLVGIQLSPDGKTVAVVTTAKETDTLHLFDAHSGKPLGEPLPCSNGIKDLAFSPDSRIIALWQDTAVRLVAANTGKHLRELKIVFPGVDESIQTGIAHTDSRTLGGWPTVAFSPNSKLLAAATYGGVVRLWHVAQGKECISVPSGHRGPVLAVGVSPDGKTVASIGQDASLRLWDLANGRETRILSLPTEEEVPALIARYLGANCVAFSPDGKTIAASWRLKNVRLWDMVTGKQRLNFLIPDGGVSSLAFRPDGGKLITGSTGRVLLWDANTGKQLHRFAAPDLVDPDLGRVEEDLEQEIALSPDGRLLAATGGRRHFMEDRHPANFDLRIWELATGQLRWRFPTGNRPRRMFEQPDTKFYVNIGYPQSRPLLAFAPDGKTLAWNQGDAIEVRDMVSGKVLRQLAGPVDNLSGIAFSPTQDVLATTSTDGRIQLWNPRTGMLLGTLEIPRGGLWCLAFSSDGRTLFTGGDDTTVLLWDMARALKQWQSRPGRLSRQELEDIWNRLAESKGGRAARAMALLEDHPRLAVQFLQEHLAPASSPPPQQVERLLADLEARAFKVRKRAMEELAKLAELAEPFLRKRLKDNPPPETRHRLERLLKKLGGFVTGPERVRTLRAVEVLEHVGTPEARRLLQKLSAGAPAALLTRQAKESLGRLRKLKASRP